MANGGVILPDQFSTEEFAYLANSQWTWTEKVDGTNVRLHYDGESIKTGGRTDNAQMSGHLMYALAQYNRPELWRDVFDLEPLSEPAIPDPPQSMDVTIYGEGYGPKIQAGGGRYRTDVGFIVFDIRIGKFWLKREDVIDIATKLGMNVVPVIEVCTLDKAISVMAAHGDGVLVHNDALRTEVGTEEFLMEGLVGTPTVPLYDRRGGRIITKLKVKDFEDLAKREVRRGTIRSKAPSFGVPASDEALI